jgi:hypothetical protein
VALSNAKSTVRPTGTPNTGQSAARGGPDRFVRMTESMVYKPRLVVSSAGYQKKGKTHLGFTMPEPIAYFAIDKGEEGVGRKFLQKDIRMIKYDFDRPTKENKGSKQLIEQAHRMMDQFEEDFDYALRNFRSLLFDTGTELYEMLRISEFGKLGEVLPHHYAPVNAKFRDWIRQVLDSDSNLLITHKVKEEWANSGGVGSKTGRIVRAGFKEVEFDVHVSIRHDRDWGERDDPKARPEITSGPFFFQVYDCRQNPDVVGQTFVQPSNEWMDLAMAVYPESDPNDWM